MRHWLIVYYRGVAFVVGEIDPESGLDNKSGFFKEGDFFLISECSASELPYPFWYTGKRTVYVRDYLQFVGEYGDGQSVVPSTLTSIGTVVEK